VAAIETVTPMLAIHPENPAFYLSFGAVNGRQGGCEKSRKAIIEIGLAQPGGDGVSVVLVRGAAFGGEGMLPEGGVDLGHR